MKTLTESTDPKNFRIRFFGILGDTWLNHVTYTRKHAQEMVHFLMTATNRFDTGRRACFTHCRVVPS